ncbi:A24 family peptidase [Oceanisphaera sp. KMM 10153]|uniref:A24 family peptidase n=1 Tax=Oceanisphaera submarina TaxID=3390193 RepID=UPI0039761FFC
MAYPVLMLWAFFCALQDANQKKISNYLTLPACAIALAWIFINGLTITGAPPIQAAITVIFTLLITLPGYLSGKLGAGDVKMLLALSLATDQMHLLWTVALAGLTMLLWALSINKTWQLVPEYLRNKVNHLSPGHIKSPPYAPFVFSGFLFSSWLLK